MLKKFIDKYTDYIIAYVSIHSTYPIDNVNVHMECYDKNILLNLNHKFHVLFTLRDDIYVTSNIMDNVICNIFAKEINFEYRKFCRSETIKDILK